MKYEIPYRVLVDKFTDMYEKAMKQENEIKCMIGKEADYRINNRDSYLTEFSDPEVLLEYCFYPMYIEGKTWIKDHLEKVLKRLALGNDIMGFYQVFSFVTTQEMMIRMYDEIPFTIDFTEIVLILEKRLPELKEEIQGYKEGDFARMKETMWNMIQRICQTAPFTGK